MVYTELGEDGKSSQHLCVAQRAAWHRTLISQSEQSNLQVLFQIKRVHFKHVLDEFRSNSSTKIS